VSWKKTKEKKGEKKKKKEKDIEEEEKNNSHLPPHLRHPPDLRPREHPGLAAGLVQPLVLPQLVRAAKVLVADLAAEAARVDLLVLGQVGRLGEALAADVAGEGLLVCVGAHVHRCFGGG
jgi:hypothetical protein